MPTYVYNCKNCKKVFEIRHSMSDKQKVCIFCNSESIFKTPSISKLKNFKTLSKKPGSLVDDYIKQTKEDIKIEKIKLKNEEM